jgi:hypothetical protein
VSYILYCFQILQFFQSDSILSNGWLHATPQINHDRRCKHMIKWQWV